MSRRHKLFCLLLATILLLGLAACHKKTIAPGEVRQTSMEKTPNWVTSPEKASTKEDRAFIGVSRQRSMEQDARTDARNDAFKQAAEALGVYVKSVLNEVVTQVDMSDDIISSALASDQLTTIQSSGITVGEVKEYYVQKFEKNVDGEIRYYYTAYCRYMVPKDYPQQMLREILDEQYEKTRDEHERMLLERAVEKLDEIDVGGF